MTSKIKITTFISLIMLGIWMGYRWQQDAPRRFCLKTLAELQTATVSGNPEGLLRQLVLPQALQGRTTAEQVEFITKVLRDEVSPAGIAYLKAHGTFGPLPQLFPAECERWSTQAGVDPGRCVAFKMQQRDLRTEVVLLRDGAGYRVVRCNNVVQLAAAAKR